MDNEPQQTLGKRLTQGLSWLTFFSSLSIFVSFFASIIIARLIGPTDFGIYVLAQSLASFVGIANKMSFSNAIAQDRVEGNAITDTTFTMVFLWSLASLLIVGIAGIALSNVYSIEISIVFLLMSAVGFVQYNGDVFSALLQRKLQYQTIGKIQLVANASGHVLSVIAAICGFGYWSLVIRDTFTVLVSFVAMFLASQYKPSFALDHRIAKRVWRYGAALFLSQNMGDFISKIDNWVVGSFFGKTQLGYYSIGFRLSLVLQQFTEPVFGKGSFGAYAELQNDKEKLSRAFFLVNYFIARITLIFGLAAFFFAESAIVFIYGNEWRAAGEIYRSLVMILVLGPFVTNLRAFFDATGRPNIVVRAFIKRILFTAVILGLFGYLGGTIGVGWAMSVSALFFFGLLQTKVKPYVDVDWKKLYFPPVAIALVVFPLSVLWRHFVLLQGWQSGLEAAVGGMGISAVCLILLILVEKSTVQAEIQYIARHFRVRYFKHTAGSST